MIPYCNEFYRKQWLQLEIEKVIFKYIKLQYGLCGFLLKGKTAWSELAFNNYDLLPIQEIYTSWLRRLSTHNTRLYFLSDMKGMSIWITASSKQHKTKTCQKKPAKDQTCAFPWILPVIRYKVHTGTSNFSTVALQQVNDSRTIYGSKQTNCPHLHLLCRGCIFFLKGFIGCMCYSIHYNK